MARIVAQAVAVRTQVIVDHVENDSDLHGMRGIHQRAEVVRRPVNSRRRKQHNAVVTPVSAAREISNGQQLDGPDAEFL